jgi:hypothetical protein
MRSFLVLTLVVAGIALSSTAPADGNPHDWDRLRRCDHIDYEPKCGACEGIGGIPHGDKNEEIDLTSCEIVATPDQIDPSTLVKPVWGSQFTVDKYYEILIGPKTDPFCFNSFPSNTSAGPLCYRVDSGKQVYDGKTLFLDLDVETPFGTVKSNVIHQGKNLWIVNQFPWYALGVHQCICSTVTEGGAGGTGLYPINYNWTDQMLFVGREKIGVEYIGPEKLHVEELNHWAFGPHHVWSTDNGEIRRMWQPYNGLEVFPEGTNNKKIDPTVFDDIPPAVCKKGGATFRLKCDDDGHTTKGVTPEPKLAAKDLSRARQRTPGPDFRGDSFDAMSKTLNRFLANDGRVATKECNEFSASEIQGLQKLLYLARDQSLDDIYQAAGDNRRLRASLEDLAKSWTSLNALTADHPEGGVIVRDGHCHEAVMWYVHHLSEDMKELLSESVKMTLPLLSYVRHDDCHDSGDHVLAKACSVYQEQVTCLSCHANVLPPGHAFLLA